MKKHKNLVISIWAAFLTIIAFYTLGENFRSGIVAPTHDSFYWTLPSFVHWARSVWNFNIPYFDFFSNGGVPFTPLIVQLRMLDPLDFVFTLFAVAVSENLVAAFNIRYFLIALANSLLLYLFVALFLRHTLSKLLLISVLILSCFLIGTFRQTGFLLVFQWSGLIFFLSYLYFFSNKHRNLKTLTVICALIANTFFGYSYVGIFLTIVFFGAIFVRRVDIRVRAKYLPLLLFLGFALPTIAVFMEREKFDYPVRAPLKIENATGQSAYVYSQYEPKTYDFARSDLLQRYDVLKDIGVFGKVRDFSTLITPEFNHNVYPNNRYPLLKLNEIYFFIGTAIAVFIPLGFWYFLRHKSRLSLVFIPFVLFYLGPDFLFHRYIYELFPPVWPFRHSILIGPFIQAFLIMFAVKGFDICLSVFGQLVNRTFSAVIKIRKFALMSIAASLFAVLLVPIFETGISVFPTDVNFVVVFTAAVLLMLKISKYRALNVFGLTVLTVVNVWQLYIHFDGARHNLVEHIPFDEAVDKKTPTETLATLIHRPALLHSGCFAVTSGQAVRYPSLMRYQRSIYSAPAPTGDEADAQYENRCAEIVDEDVLRGMERWSVIAVYKPYLQNMVNKDENLFEKMLYIIPKKELRSKAVDVTSSSITFSDVEKGSYAVNLFYDEHWQASCDGKSLDIVPNNVDEIAATVFTLEDGFAIKSDKFCKKLVLAYYPKLFAYSTYFIIFCHLALGVYLAFIGTLGYLRRRGIYPKDAC